MAKLFIICMILTFSVFSSTDVGAVQDSASGFILPQYSQKVSLDFKNADVKDVLKSFSRQISANFILDKTVPDLKLTLFLDDVPVEEALNKVLSVNGLAYEYDEGMNLFVVKIQDTASEELITRVYPLRYASVDSSKIKQAGGVSSGASTGGFGASFLPVLTAKGKMVDNARTNSIVVTDVEENFPNIERLLALLDVPLRQVIIEVEMLDVLKTTADRIGAKFESFTLTLKSAVKTGGSYFPYDKEKIMNNYGGDMPKYTPASATINASALLEAYKTDSNTKTLARPRIFTADNETAIIQITINQVVGIKVTETDGGNSTTEAERVDTGVFLTVTPQVNVMTDEITLTVEPKVSDKGICAEGYCSPSERTAKVSLRVPDGKTIVIGGLLQRSRSNNRAEIPLLGRIPFLGAAFRHAVKADSESELIIFLTPHIIDGDLSIPADLKQEVDRQMQLREQTPLDSREGSIDKEMDEVNRFRKGL